MIGKSLNERHTLGPLAADDAIALMKELLGSQGKPLVEVRARDPRMVACLVARADEASVRFCRALGFRLSRGGTGVFGVLGSDAARLFADLAAHQQTWLETPCAARETKVVLVTDGKRALLSIDTSDGKVAITAVS
jgi:hypothetical protein